MTEVPQEENGKAFSWLQGNIWESRACGPRGSRVQGEKGVTALAANRPHSGTVKRAQRRRPRGAG